MRTTKLPSKLFALVVLAVGSGTAQTLAGSMPETENGRYALSPAGDGVLRLDTRTGAVSTCNNNTGAGWACYTVPDERAAMDTEIGRLQGDVVRLQAENDRLKSQLASREPPGSGKIDEALPKSEPLAPAEPKAAESGRKIEIPLPSDRDMDRMMSFLERAWRRLVDMASRVQRDIDGKI